MKDKKIRSKASEAHKVKKFLTYSFSLLAGLTSVYNGSIGWSVLNDQNSTEIASVRPDSALAWGIEHHRTFTAIAFFGLSACCAYTTLKMIENTLDHKRKGGEEDVYMYSVLRPEVFDNPAINYEPEATVQVEN